MALQSTTPQDPLRDPDVAPGLAPEGPEEVRPDALARRPRFASVSRFGLVGACLLVLAAVLGPLLFPDPSTVTLANRLQPPVGFGGSWDHPLGTDGLGRDVLSGILSGARVSLLVGVGAVVVASAIGIPLGLLAGYRGKGTDAVITWLIDFQLGFPALLLILLIAGYVEAGVLPLIITLGIVSWMMFARLARSLALSLRESDFVAASQLAGSSTAKILRRHLLPNMISPLVTLALLHVATAMLGESALSYLGFGISRPDASWGLMIAEGQQYLRIAWWIVITPGAMLAFAVLMFHELARSLRPHPVIYRKPTT